MSPISIGPLTPEQCKKIRSLAADGDPADLLGEKEDYFGADIVLALLDTIDHLREES